MAHFADSPRTHNLHRVGSNEVLNRLILNKAYDQPSVFTPENLLREARRQKSLPAGPIPSICILDPDGDILRTLLATNRATRNPFWPCYHTDLYDFRYEELEFGIVGCAVGAAFAVLVAEELFASGCELLISLTSSGQILPDGDPPYFVLIEKALRDEGTSYHYLPPSDYSFLSRDLALILKCAFSSLHVPVRRGITWTTDAPFRETPSAIEQARGLGVTAVEMEASALYAFGAAAQRPVVCFAHVTNQMAVIEGDFEKGDAQGTTDALQLISATARAWLVADPKPSIAR